MTRPGAWAGVAGAALAAVISLVSPAWADPGISGMTGYWNAPSAQVLGDGEAQIGYNIIPSPEAWDLRGSYRNDVYFGAVGILPRIETLFRVTAIPGYRKFANLDSLSNYGDADRMVGAKVQVVRASRSLPDVAVGIEDPLGTRRFHTGYVVVGRGWEMGTTQLRADVGYAGAVIKPHAGVTLSGAFLGVEARPVRAAGVVLEYDTEKWNVGVRFRGPYGFHGGLVWMGGRAWGGGFGFHLQL